MLTDLTYLPAEMPVRISHFEISKRFLTEIAVPDDVIYAVADSFDDSFTQALQQFARRFESYEAMHLTVGG